MLAERIAANTKAIDENTKAVRLKESEAQLALRSVRLGGHHSKNAKTGRKQDTAQPPAQHPREPPRLGPSSRDAMPDGGSLSA